MIYYIYMKNRDNQQNSFILELPSKDAIKLANAIYNTYIYEGKNPYLDLSVKRLCEMYGFSNTEASYQKIKTIFEDLNEPAVVENFKYLGRIIDWKVITFCEFEHVWRDEDAFIEINLNELFLSAMQYFMKEPYLPFKKLT